MEPAAVAAAPSSTTPAGAEAATDPPAPTTSSSSPKTMTTTPKKPRMITRKQANALVIDSGIAIRAALEQLEEARLLAAQAGLSVECHTLPRNLVTPSALANAALAGESSWSLDQHHHTPSSSSSSTHPPPEQPGVSLTTGGHSNTDHNIVRTGDPKRDRLAELRRNAWRRHRSMQPETRGDDRWDKPKRLPGERRRRIVREKDLPEAPPEPPPAGYVVFVGQMTTKIRHDRPDTPHDQARVMQEISKLWRIGMTEEERDYYNRFASDAKGEYQKQMVEFRATGTYTPNHEFVKLPEVNVWVRREELRNGLEKEICGYSNLVFRKRPRSMDEAYEKREERSIFRRKLKIKGLLNDDGTLKDPNADFEDLLAQDRKQKAARAAAAAKGGEAPGTEAAPTETPPSSDDQPTTATSEEGSSNEAAS